MKKALLFLGEKLIALIRSLLGFIVAIALGLVVSNVASHLIQKPLNIAAPEIELVNYDPGGISILPGEVIDYAPYIINTGDSSVYTVITFTCSCYDPGTAEMDEDWQPTTSSAKDADNTSTTGSTDSTDSVIPAFIIKPNSGWELKDTSVNNGEMKRIYAYTQVLSPGESTPPLCDSIQYNLFTNYAFSMMDDEELNFNISCNAGNSDMVSIDGVVSQIRQSRVDDE